jgi:four helix bundle protein
MQRAAVSIPSNIAEGYLRSHRKEYIQFLSISIGSAAELETQILICKSINKFSLVDFSKAEHLTNEILKMLTSLIHKLSNP